VRCMSGSLCIGYESVVICCFCFDSFGGDEHIVYRLKAESICLAQKPLHGTAS
jgi:hypothetical protein